MGSQYMLLVVALSLTAALAQQGLYLSNSTHILLKPTGSSELQVIIAQPRGRIVGLAVDSRNGYIFWSDVSHAKKGIYKSRMNGADLQRIIQSEVGDINGLSIDWVARHVYWTDAEKRTLEVADYQGMNRRQLHVHGLHTPRAVVTDPINGWLYWNDQGQRTIVKSRLDGSGQVTIVSSGLYWPNQMVVYKHKLYYLDGWNKTLSVCNHDGTDHRVISNMMTLTEDNPLFGLSINNNMAYVSVWNKGKVHEVNLQRGSTRVFLLGVGYEAMFGMAYYNLALQPQGSNVCGRADKNGCSHLCLSTSRHSGRCACPSRGGLALYNKQCSEARSLLFYVIAGSGEVGYQALDSSYPSDRYTISNSPRPVAVAYDSSSQLVYWSDVKQKAIFTASLDGRQKTVFLNASDSLGNVDGMSFDPVSQRLYFSNMGFVQTRGAAFWWHKIEMIKADRTGRKIVTSSASKPRGLWVDPGKYLYYTDWGDNAGVFRTDLDGSNSVNIRTGLDNPNSVILHNNKLYVADSHDKTRTQTRYPRPEREGGIYSVQTNGGGWTEQTYSNINKQTKIPYAVAAHGDALFVSDWGMNAVVAVYQNGTVHVVLDNVDTPAGILYSSRTSASPGDDPCSSQQGRQCEEICTASPTGGTTCSCNSYKPEFLAEDNRHCSAPNSFLLVADTTNIKLVTPAPSSETPPQQILSGPSFFNNITSVCYDHVTGRIYYYNHIQHAILWTSLNVTSSVKLIALGNGTAGGLAISRTTQRLYWTDTARGHIAHIALTGGNSTYHVMNKGLVKPTSIISFKGYLYWLEAGDVAVMSENAGWRQVLVRYQFVSPTALAIDADSKELFIADKDLDGVSDVIKCNLNGSSCERTNLLPPGSGAISSMWITLGWLYYADQDRGTVEAVYIQTGETKDIVSHLVRPTGIFMHTLPLRSECPINHGCSDRCIPTVGGLVCGCETGRSLQKDQKTCQSGPGDGWIEAPPQRCKTPCNSSRNLVCSQLLSSLQFRCHCKAGYRPQHGGSCEACEGNHYKPSVGPESCRQCILTNVTTTRGSTSCPCTGDLVWNQDVDTCSASRDGKCPVCTNQRVTCGKSCDSDIDCDWPQKCCQQEGCVRRVCMDPILDYQCVFNHTLYPKGQSYKKDVCTVCVCVKSSKIDNGCGNGAVCQRTICPPNPCGGNAKLEVGKCCPVCPKVSKPESDKNQGHLAITHCPTGTKMLYLPSKDATHVKYDDVIRFTDRLRRDPELIVVTRYPPHTLFKWKVQEVRQVIHVTVKAVDATQEKDNCSYAIIVKDTQKPNLNCPNKDAIRKYTGGESIRVFFVVTSDDPGSGLIKGHPKPTDASKASGAIFAIGLHEVSYRAKDKAGNEDTCTFNVKVIKSDPLPCDLTEINRGNVRCSDNGNYSQCSVQCQEGLEANHMLPEEFICLNNQLLPTLPQHYPSLSCVDMKPWTLRLPMTMNLNDTWWQESLTTEFLQGVKQGFISTLRRVDGGYMVPEQSVKVKVGEENPTRKRRETKQRASIIIDFTAETPYNNTSSRKEGERQLMLLYQALSQAVNSTSFVVPANGQFLVGVNLTKGYTIKGCLIGQQETEGGCFMCPIQTYYNQETGQCTVCPPGSYQAEDGQTSCLKCPSSKTLNPAAYLMCHTEDPVVQPDTEETSSDRHFTLIIGVTVGVGVLVIVVIILSISLYMCRKRTPNPREGAARTPSEGLTNPSYLYFNNNNNPDTEYQELPRGQGIELKDYDD